MEQRRRFPGPNFPNKPKLGNTKARPKPGSLQGKLDQVATYIQNNASGSGGVTQMTCPSPKRWAELSTGNQAVLPSVTVLGLYADEKIKASAQVLGGLEAAYFEAARRQLLKK